MDLKISSGCEVLNSLIGGIEAGIITTIYGPFASGKSNLCLMLASAVAKEKKVIFIDTEGGFSVERLRQISGEYFEKVIDNIIILRPTNFDEQKKAIRLLNGMTDEKIGAIIVDTISMLYRVEIGGKEESYVANKELGKQIVLLSEIARKRNIPVLIANQVYADFKNPGKVVMVGGDLLKYGSKCIIEILKHRGCKTLVLKRHRSIGSKSVNFNIVESGFKEVDKIISY
jgi:DNA repair protein RadB